MKDYRQNGFWRWVTILVGAITAPGIVDGLVTWQRWYENGWMQHWRVLKEWIIPFELPNWLFWLPEYLLIGLIVSRSFAVLFLSELEFRTTRLRRIIFGIIMLFLLFTAIVAFWPAALVLIMRPFMSKGSLLPLFSRAERRFILSAVLISTIGAIIIIFTASDAIIRLSL